MSHVEFELAPKFANTPLGIEAEELLDKCIDCGQCMVKCPTFRLLNEDEESPRGRIQLMRKMYATGVVDHELQQRLDHCLTCRSCEAMCPEHVPFGHLLDITKSYIESELPRSWRTRLLRLGMRLVVPFRGRFGLALFLGRLFRKQLSPTLRAKVELPVAAAGPWPDQPRKRRMLVWTGCVQPSLGPSINAAAARVLDRFGIHLETGDEGCCGALSLHMAAPEESLAHMRRNIDALWPQVEAGIEAIVMTSSGCGAHLRDYGKLLADDPRYAAKAQRITELVRDIAEVVAAEWREDLLPIPPRAGPPPRIAWQSPCSLQHGQGINGVVENILKRAGFKLTLTDYPFLCCGSAGSYSVLEPELAAGLREAKLKTLLGTRATLIATGNIGCQHHLAVSSPVPVRHWIELLDETFAEAWPH
ncbi:MAG: glycolate oxidase subunit GlcF [Rhodocyclales bacterium]|nr:glycolate oxidase subunit GlcF [Rhodocyclales bacterium]